MDGVLFALGLWKESVAGKQNVQLNKIIFNQKCTTESGYVTWKNNNIDHTGVIHNQARLSIFWTQLM